MPTQRIKPWPLPPPAKSGDTTSEYLNSLYRALVENSTEGLQDFDMLKLANVPWVDVRKYGAKGDGTTDDTTAIQAAINACDAGGTIFIPSGNYKITDTLVLKSGITILGASGVRTYYGIPSGKEKPVYIYQATPSKHIFLIGENIQNVQFRNFSMGANPSPSMSPVSGKYGIRMLGNAPNDTNFITFDNLIFYDFDRAISVEDSGLPPYDWSCCPVKLNHCVFLANNIGVYFHTINADAWVFDSCGFMVPTDGIGVHADLSGFFTMINCTGGGWSVNNNTWLKITGPVDTIQLIACQVESCWAFIDVDPSGSPDHLRPIILNGCLPEANIYLRRKCHFISIGSRYTHPVYPTGNDILIDSIGDWFLEDVGFYYFGVGSKINNCLASIGAIGGTPGNVFMGYNEHVHEIVPPSQGTWKRGDRIWNTSPSAGGAPGWVCTTSGTFSDAIDETGDTDGTTAVITGMTDTSDFLAGEYVTVSAGFPTTGPYRIIDKTSTTITLDTNSNSAQNNITVQTPDPVFKAMSNLAS